MRFWALLSLAAGLIGCESTPLREDLREELAAAEAPGAAQVEMESAPTPTFQAPERRGPHTRLHIPEKYLDRIDWEMGADSDESTAEVVIEAADREQEAAPTPQRRNYRRPRYRGSRRARRRQFRTVGLRVTVSRFGGGHPVGLPGHSIGLPAQAVRSPGQAVGLPAQAVGLPSHAVRRPNHAVKLPAHAVGRPGHAVRLPGQAVRLPEHSVNRPGHSVNRPWHPVGLPGHSLGRSAHQKKQSKQPALTGSG